MSLQSEDAVATASARPRRAKQARKKTPVKAKTAPARKAARKKAAPARKSRAAAAEAAEGTKAPPARAGQTWVAQFIFADAAGEAQVSLMTIEADTADDARAFAAAHAPAAEFMVSVHPCSDEQFLGQVRLSALEAAGK